MKKTRKLLSLLLAASMLPVSFAAHAEEEAAIKGVNSDIPYGWELKYHTYNTSWNKEQDYVGIAYGKGVDGTNALYAHFESPIEAHRYVRATIPV